MASLLSTSASACSSNFPILPYCYYSRNCLNSYSIILNKKHKPSFTSIHASSEKPDTPVVIVGDNVDESLQNGEVEGSPNEGTLSKGSDIPNYTVGASGIPKDLKKVVNKTAATFAPRASTARKNPAVPGSALYTIFEVQAYASMLVGGVLSFNLLFPSNEPDIWRLMGMWSIWMFTIPSLRARDCSNREKEALNYLFILVPLLNVIIPFFWKSFAVVWSADTVAFFLMYAWKMRWLQEAD